MRKEPIVFAAAVLVLGWLAWSSRGEGVARAMRGQRADPPELEHHPAPDPAIVLPIKRPGDDGRPRELFSPPSDTHPLPPLELDPLPRAPLAMLLPPPEPGPGPALYGRYLRVKPYRIQAPNLFEAGAEAEVEEVEGADDPAAVIKPSELTPEEKAQRISGLKKLYDWVRTNEFKFGQIKNPNRYQLSRRPGEDIQFIEFNPATGLPRLPKQGPVPISRALVTEFDFAETVLNQIEKRRAEFDDPLSASQYEGAIAFADWCVERRLETPRALEVAEEMYRRAMPVLAEDAAPHLGVARCYEAGFEFEKAFQEYRALLEGVHARDPVVLSRLAGLEARFRLFREADARFAEAERYGRSQWQVQHDYGGYLFERGRTQEAIEHLRLASQYEPAGAERKQERARIRVDLAAALLRAGDVRGAAEWFEKGRQADPTDQQALAGALCAATILATPGGSANAPKNPGNGGGGTASPAAAPPDLTGVGFDLLLASGIEAIGHRDANSAERARANLQLAAAVDPLRAHLAWRALSYLAEVTDHPEVALRFAEQAVENGPDDAYALYHRGRLLAERDDLDGAMQSFSRALEVELDFPDALAAMGEIQNRRGDYASAERYLERALSLDPSLANVAALRGVNFLGLSNLHDAEEAFKAARAITPDEPTAWLGLAWCRYLVGDVEEALTRLRELDDSRRAFPEDDPHRVWARTEIARIQDHVEKVVWVDRFERTDLRMGWERDERAGPQFSIHDGYVSLNGVFKSDGVARGWQVRSASSFVAIEARITIHAGTTARVGIFVSRETARAGETQVEAAVTLSRHPDAGANTIQTRVMKRGEEDLAYTDVAGFDWKLEKPVVVRIERTGESSDTKVRLLVDGFPVLDGKAVPNLGRTTSELRLGVFAEGKTGRQVQIDIDDVEIVYRAK